MVASVKSFAALFKKELKSIIWITLPLTILLIVSMLFSWWAGENRRLHPANEYLNLFRIYPTISYILAVVFLYSLVIERKTKTSFQLLSLPVHTSYVILTKILAVYTIGIGFYSSTLLCGISAVSHIFSTEDENEWQLLFRKLHGIPSLISIKHLTPRFPDLIMQCGILSVSFGVSLLFKRRPVFWGILTYILCLFIIKWTSDTFIWSYFGKTGIRNFPFISGIGFMIVGLILYEKYCEV